MLPHLGVTKCEIVIRNFMRGSAFNTSASFVISPTNLFMWNILQTALQLDCPCPEARHCIIREMRFSFYQCCGKNSSWCFKYYIMASISPTIHDLPMQSLHFQFYQYCHYISSSTLPIANIFVILLYLCCPNVSSSLPILPLYFQYYSTNVATIFLVLLHHCCHYFSILFPSSRRFESTLFVYLV